MAWIQNGNIYTNFTISRNFSAIKDHEYADIDYCEDKEYDGLDEYVHVTPNMITKVDENLWKVEAEDGTFRLKPAEIIRYVF